jgi:hypothetical protein
LQEEIMSGITIENGHVYGGWRQPVNISADVKGSIHDDEAARRLGMRGGTVAGNIHLEQFPPVLIEAFGPRWFERGTLSVFYTYATKDREDVRVAVGVPPRGAENAQTDAWMETRDGHVVCRGTASVGRSEEPTSLDAIELKDAEPGELRILAGLSARDKLPPRQSVITPEDVSARLEVITEPLDWYTGDSPWGGPIAIPSLMFGAMRVDFQIPIQGVSFQGATELRNVNGPVKVGVPYRAGGELICVGISSKTEYFWFDAYLEDEASGTRVAEMRMMRRFMKASSPLYGT